MSTYRQLKQQIAELEKKAAIAMKEEARKAIETIKRQIAEFGLSAADLGLEIARRAGAKTTKGKKLVLTPKYREPGTGKTWNGHGKRPGWIVAAQKKGKLDELSIVQARAGQGFSAGQGSGEARGEEGAEESRAGSQACGEESAEVASGTRAEEPYGRAESRSEEACSQDASGEEASGEEGGWASQEASARRGAGSSGNDRSRDDRRLKLRASKLRPGCRPASGQDLRRRLGGLNRQVDPAFGELCDCHSWQRWALTGTAPSGNDAAVRNRAAARRMFVMSIVERGESYVKVQGYEEGPEEGAAEDGEGEEAGQT